MDLFLGWIKKFHGASPNAIKTKIWIALVRKRVMLDLRRYAFLQIRCVTLFEKTPIDPSLSGDVEFATPPRAKSAIFESGRTTGTIRHFRGTFALS